MDYPTADQVRRAVDSDDPAVACGARDLVLAARDVIADHCSNAWGYRVDSGAGITGYKSVCGCRECDRLTPISRLLLPEERPATQAPANPGTHPHRTVWSVVRALVASPRSGYQ